MNSSSQISKPLTIDVAPMKLTIRFADSHESVYPSRYLRESCRCANCVNELNGEPILDKTTVSPAIRIVKAEPVGHYALSLTFSDLHSTGIYPYDILRRMCPCLACVG